MFTKIFPKLKKNKTPVKLMKESIKKANKEVDKLKDHFLLVQSELVSYEDTLLERKNEKENLIAEARKHKRKNDKVASHNALKLAVKIESWIEKIQPAINDLRMKSYEIKEYATKVTHSIENYELELDLIQSSSSMAQYKLDEYNQSLNLNDMNNLIKEANDYIDIMNAKIDASEDLHKISQSHKAIPTPKDNQAIVKNLYDKL